MKRVVAGIVLGLCVLGNSYAAIDVREFADDVQRQRFYDLATVLRCPKCQNQSIAESSAPIANDLRGEIQRKMKARSEERRVGKECVSTCRYRGVPYN